MIDNALENTRIATITFSAFNVAFGVRSHDVPLKSARVSHSHSLALALARLMNPARRCTVGRDAALQGAPATGEERDQRPCPLVNNATNIGAPTCCCCCYCYCIALSLLLLLLVQSLSAIPCSPTNTTLTDRATTYTLAYPRWNTTLMKLVGVPKMLGSSQVARGARGHSLRCPLPRTAPALATIHDPD